MGYGGYPNPAYYGYGGAGAYYPPYGPATPAHGGPAGVSGVTGVGGVAVPPPPFAGAPPAPHYAPEGYLPPNPQW